MSPFHGYHGDGAIGSALFGAGGVRSRKRVFASAADAAGEPVTAKRQRRGEAQVFSLDALPNACLCEVLRRVQGSRARCASACVSCRWLALLAGIRASEAVLAPAVLDPTGA